jgi:beta-glucanase (GH16 family)
MLKHNTMKLLTVVCLLLLIPFVYCKKNTASSLISVSNISVVRDSVNSTIKLVVTVEPVSNQAITVAYTTVDGTAKSNIDFVPASGTLIINPNTSSVEIQVQLIGRKLLSSTQDFTVKLSNAVNASLKVDQATVFIENPGFDYQLVWSDEFDGTVLNTANWNYETGGGGWGNNELENYTSGTNNAYIENGNLVIEAKKERSGNNAYSSARLTTKGKRKFTYGKIEIKAKVPATAGLWPAIWMLGENIDQVSWPSCGEIDIMEAINKETPSKIYGTAHWGINTSNHLSKGGSYALSSGYYSDNYHIFSVEWDANSIVWLYDGNRFYSVNKADVTGGNNPFNKDFFLILNVAVGGNWPGSPDATSVFPQKMMVDYVRVYQK